MYRKIKNIVLISKLYVLQNGNYYNIHGPASKLLRKLKGLLVVALKWNFSNMGKANNGLFQK